MLEHGCVDQKEKGHIEQQCLYKECFYQPCVLDKEKRHGSGVCSWILIFQSWVAQMYAEDMLPVWAPDIVKLACQSGAGLLPEWR